MENEIIQKNKSKLEELNIKFEHYELDSEAHNVAEVKNLIQKYIPEIKESEIVKTIIMMLDECPTVFLILGDKKIDFRKVKETTSAENMRMAEYDEVETIGSVGAIFPFNVSAKVYVDKNLIGLEKTIINFGTLKDVIKLNGKDLEKINNSQIGDFI